MSVILILILASLAVAVAFLGCFIWAAKAGQFEDTCTPAMRILGEDKAPPGRASVLASPNPSGDERIQGSPSQEIQGSRGRSPSQAWK